MAHDYKKIINSYEAKAKTIPSIRNEFEKLSTWYYSSNENDKLNYDYRQSLAELIKNSIECDFQDDRNASEVKKDLNSLIEKINEEIGKTSRKSKKQYRIAILEIPIVIVILFVVFILKLINCICLGNNELFVLSVVILLTTVIHSHFLLRFYQQSISLEKELMEKEFGIEFLKHAISDPINKEIYQFGVKMFLQHHAFKAPYNEGDKPFAMK